MLFAPASAGQPPDDDKPIEPWLTWSLERGGIVKRKGKILLNDFRTEEPPYSFAQLGYPIALTTA